MILLSSIRIGQTPEVLSWTRQIRDVWTTYILLMQPTRPASSTRSRSWSTNKAILFFKIGLIFSVILFTALLLSAVWFLASCQCCGIISLGGLFKWMIFCSIFVTGTFAFSFMLCKAFLKGMLDDEYCITSTHQLDAIYIVLPLYWHSGDSL